MFVFHSIHLIFIFKILMANKLKVTAATNLKISSLVPLIPDKKFVAVEYYRFAIIPWALIAGYLAESPCFPRQGLRLWTAPPAHLFKIGTQVSGCLPPLVNCPLVSDALLGWWGRVGPTSHYHSKTLNSTPGKSSGGGKVPWEPSDHISWHLDSHKYKAGVVSPKNNCSLPGQTLSFFGSSML